MTNDVNNLNIHHRVFLCQRVYEEKKSWTMLQSYEFAEINMIIEGNGIFLVFEQAIPCKAGDVFVTPPNIPHKFFVENEGDKLSIRNLSFVVEEFKSGNSAESLYGLFDDGSVTACATLNGFMIKKVGALLDEIEYELLKKKKAWQDAVVNNLSLLLINIERYIENSIKNELAVTPKEWNIVLSAMKIIKDKCSETELTLNSISETFGISASHMSRAFQKMTGKQFTEYLRSARMDYACEMLKGSELTVEEIVGKCGLRDIASFYKNFHSYTGMTPNEYRQFVRGCNNKSNNIINEKGEKLMVVLSEISENLQKGKAKIVKELVQQAIDEGGNPEQILNEGLLAGMSVIGEKFKNNEIFIPDVLVAARAMNMGTQILKPLLMANGVGTVGKACIGTVQGDLHDIGKNLVKMMLEGKGFEVIDLGTDVAPETFVQTAVEQDCQIICCSALLTTTMDVMEDVVKAADAAGIRDKVKIMIGGAPVSEEFCKKIGADCYTVDAASAAEAALELCKG